MFDWVLDTPLTCLKKDKNCEKPVKELFLETLQQRLRNNFYEISEKNSNEKWFSSKSFSAVSREIQKQSSEVFYKESYS